ncbi:MAG: c-type cytochrome [Acidimicrobiia bacterium]
MSFRTILIIINLVAVAALVGFVLYRVVSLRRNPHQRDPENLTPFFDDEVMEGAHLERALGVALVALVVVLIGMVVYFVREPFRSNEAHAFFKDQSVERGAVLFSAPQSEAYNSTVSLQCARCHGLDGGGGSATFIIKSVDPRCDPKQTVDEQLAANQPYCLPKDVAWAAPNLQLASLRYSRAQLTQIITYGRPGTPMPAWGVLSGRGALNAQSIKDLVNYVESIGTTTDKAKALATSDLADFSKTLADPAVIAAADDWVKQATAEVAAAQADVDARGPDAPLGATLQDGSKTTTTGNYLEFTQENLTAATEWRQTVKQASDGAKLFMNNCARCHTRGWSYFVPTDPTETSQGRMGGGAYGPNLRDGDVNTQFSPPGGDAELFAWISEGVEANQQYGARGISSGRMPHFGAVLSSKQICQIMAYERNIDDPPLTTANDQDCVAAAS